MGPQHIRDEVLSWTRGKTERSTGIELAIPVHPDLRAVINESRNEHLTFLVTADRKRLARSAMEKVKRRTLSD